MYVQCGGGGGDQALWNSANKGIKMEFNTTKTKMKENTLPQMMNGSAQTNTKLTYSC